jgi:two-component sensor histidine kinase
MQPPSLPANESERLAKLHDYQILDTPPEAAFDDIAVVAAHVLHVPIALVTLVDADRQWFKARYGLADQQTPRDFAFCGHVVGDDHELVVPDAHEDQRFFDNPLVVGHPRVRFYAGVPLRTQEGLVLGTLCAIDHVPRAVTAEQRAVLKALARQVMGQLELRRRNRELIEQQQETARLEETLRSSLHEKDVLLQEVHHRVKNNLQLVSSLINLQRVLIPTGLARSALDECQGRIHTIAVVHEAIYVERDYARIPIARYVRMLSSSIFHAMGAAVRGIELQLELGDAQLPVDLAIPCGLILNELLTNAFKHAFPAGRRGTVSVTFEALPDARLRMVIGDDGVGLPADFTLDDASSVGMQVVVALVEQLEASFEISRQGGTQFTMIFKMEG